MATGLDDLRRETVTLLADTRAALRKEQGANRKLDALLDSAESLTGTADSAGRLAHKVLTHPFVKVAAFFTGGGACAWSSEQADRVRTTRVFVFRMDVTG